MPFNSRILSPLKRKCRRGLSSSASQLKPEITNEGNTVPASFIPTRKSWAVPSSIPPAKSNGMDPRSASQVHTRKKWATSPSSSPLKTSKVDPRPVYPDKKRTLISERIPPNQTSGVGHSSLGQTMDKSPQSGSQISLSETRLQHSYSSTPRKSYPQSNRQGHIQQHGGPSRRTSQNMQRDTEGAVIPPERQMPNYRPNVKGSTLSHNTPPKKSLLKTRKIRSNRPRKNVFIPTTLTVATLAKLLKVKLDFLLHRMHQVGMEQEANYDYILTSDYAVLLAEELGFNAIVDDEAAFDLHAPQPHPNPSTLPPRPPIVTIMGHVDHGKTTLLDTLRSASVAKGEAGGITQHIGAFSVPVGSGTQTITFLDTPGHAAFSAMRARGADVTDIVVLVVAADDGIMPQTKEVINLLKREGKHVGLVVAINKIDKPGTDSESVKKALLSEGIQLEEFGGDVPSVLVSGLTGQGLPELVETLSAMAEVQDLRAEQDSSVFGHILESNFNKGLGPVATVLVQRGSLNIGARIISGLNQGKVRSMTDSNGKTVRVAIPGMAVTVSGWKTLPKAGDEVLEGSESDIKKALANRVRMTEKETLHNDVEAINSSRKLNRDAREEVVEAHARVTKTTSAAELAGPKELKLILKADVSGSSEALEGALHDIGNSIATSKVLSTGVGDITESDVMMARVANATIIGFSVSAPRSVQNLAAQNGVQIFTSDIIYRLIEDVRSRIIALLPVTIESKVVGEATVLQLFEIQLKSKETMKVAGCRVTNGIVEKQKFARVVRNGEIIHQGSLETMRHLKKDITEARKGMECGLSFQDFTDLRDRDVIQMYEKIEKPGIL